MAFRRSAPTGADKVGNKKESLTSDGGRIGWRRRTMRSGVTQGIESRQGD